MRQFKIADRFGDNYSTAIARIMCDVKCLDYPSYTKYEDEVGEKEFWKFQDLDYSPENYWVENDKQEIWDEGFRDLFIDGHLANSYAEWYMNDHMHPITIEWTLENGMQYELYQECVRLFRDYYDLELRELLTFDLRLTITPEDWAFEGRQAGYYSVIFDVDSDINATWIDYNGEENSDAGWSIGDLIFDDWVAEYWKSEIGLAYLNDDEAFTKDIDEALNEYVDACGQEVANHIYFNSYYEEENSNGNE